MYLYIKENLTIQDAKKNYQQLDLTAPTIAWYQDKRLK